MVLTSRRSVARSFATRRGLRAELDVLSLSDDISIISFDASAASQCLVLLVKRRGAECDRRLLVRVAGMVSCVSDFMGSQLYIVLYNNTELNLWSVIVHLSFLFCSKSGVV